MLFADSARRLYVSPDTGKPILHAKTGYAQQPDLISEIFVNLLLRVRQSLRVLTVGFGSARYRAFTPKQCKIHQDANLFV